MARNRPPRFTAPLTAAVVEDDPLHAKAGGSVFATVSDPDAGDTLHLVSIDGIATGFIRGKYGTLSWDDAAGTFLYQIDNSLRAVQRLGFAQAVQESFVVQVADAAGAAGNGRLIVTVVGSNDAPVAHARSQTVTEDVTLTATGNFLSGAKDADQGDPLRVLLVDGATATTVAGSYGTLVWNPVTGDYTYTLSDHMAAVQALGVGEQLRESFSFTIADQGGATDTKTLTIRIDGTNDAPVAPDILGSAVSAGVPGAQFTLTAMGASDVDGDTLSVAAVQGYGVPGTLLGTYGRLSWAANGLATYTLDTTLASTQALGAGQFAIERFGVTLSDGHGGVATRAVEIVVAGVNDPARIDGSSLGTVVEDVQPIATGRVVVVDPDSGESVLRDPGGNGAGLYGTFTVNAATGDWSYILDSSRPQVQALAAGQIATDTLLLVSADGSASRMLTVLVVGTSTVPIAVSDSFTTAEDTPLHVVAGPGATTLLSNDSGGDGALSVVAGSYATAHGGTVTVFASGGFDYTPAADFNGKDSFTYLLADSDGDRVQGSASITVTPVLDLIAPVRLADIAAGHGGFAITSSGVDGFGSAVAAAGDINGDGRADLIIGAPADDTYGYNSGMAYAIYGKASGDLVRVDYLGGSGFRILGGWGYEQAGIGVGGGLDVNGDGVPDLIVGANLDSDGGGRAGAAYVILGHPGMSSVPLWSAPFGTGDGFKIVGEDSLNDAGYAVAMIGDLNGDGLAEILVGAPSASAAGRTSSGAAYVVWGKATTTAIDLDQVAQGVGGFKVLGAATTDWIGANVAALGDVNGDGRPDFVVDAEDRARSDAPYAGGAYVVFGKSTGAAVDLADIAADHGGGFRIRGEAANDQAGSGLAAAGDVNGDGLADIILGAQGVSAGGRAENGAAYVVFGKANTGTVDLTAVAAGHGGFRIVGAAAGDGAGLGVAGIGDIDGDGHADLMITSGNAAFVVFGKSDGAEVDLAQIATGVGGFVIQGENGRPAPSAITAVGDMNGDGRTDLAISTFNGPTYVVFGQASWHPDTVLA